jgi:hypothetical protein
MALNTLTFTSSTTWTVPNGVSLMETVFVVGGGGSGGAYSGGGGAGGQVIWTTNVAVGATVGITIGGSNQASSFGSITAASGGAGGNTGNGGTTSQSIKGVGATYYGGAVYGYTPPNQGTRYSGGGGAGAGSNGYTSGPFPGAGGDGYRWPVTGNYYGGGGGGGGDSTVNNQTGNANSLGGLGGGGAGSVNGGGASGAANTGGGGGGGNRGSGGGAGGTGIIIVQYYDPSYFLTTSQPGIAEGETITVTLKTMNVANNAVLQYSLSGSGITAGDFASNSLTGNFTVTSTDGGATGTATTTITLVNDSTTEGNEVVTLALSNGFASTSFIVGDASRGGFTNITSKTISQADYNTTRNKVVSVLGVGSGNFGYGQTVLSTAVAEGNTVSINEWGKLRYDIINAWIHLYGTAPTLSTVALGNTVVGNAFTAPYGQYDTYSNVLVSNRMDSPVASQYITRSAPPAPRTEVWNTSYGTPWVSRLSALISVSWSNADAARYFFNAGGEIRFNSGRSGGSGTPQNNAWTQILINAGMVRFGGAFPGPLNGSGVNFYTLTSTFQTYFSVDTSNPYSANVFRISARTPGVTNTLGTASAMEFLVEWVDNHVGTSGGPDAADGTISLYATTLEATGILQPSGTGNFVIEGPVISMGAVIPG